jgi:hypothetical protein
VQEPAHVVAFTPDPPLRIAKFPGASAGHPASLLEMTMEVTSFDVLGGRLAPPS